MIFIYHMHTQLPANEVSLDPSMTTYLLAAGLGGSTRTLTVYNNQSPSYMKSAIRLVSLETDGMFQMSQLAPTMKTRHIEFVGDSITAATNLRRPHGDPAFGIPAKGPCGDGGLYSDYPLSYEAQVIYIYTRDDVDMCLLASPRCTVSQPQTQPLSTPPTLNSYARRLVQTAPRSQWVVMACTSTAATTARKCRGSTNKPPKTVGQPVPSTSSTRASRQTPSSSTSVRGEDEGRRFQDESKVEARARASRSSVL